MATMKQLHYSGSLTHPRRHADAHTRHLRNTTRALPALRVLDRGVHAPARVNVTCVTPLGEEVASTS